MSDLREAGGPSAPEDSDAQLIARHLGGDRRAFDAIVDRYERRVYGVCLHMCGDQEDARDAMQDSFIAALRGLPSFRSDARLSTWLHRIAVNASLDVIRRRGRHAAQPIEAVEELTSSSAGPEDEAIGAQRALEVRRAIAGLSDEHRAVVVLHDLQGMQYAEVAEALEVPVGTVKSRIHRARLELASLLGHLKEPAGEDRPLT